MELAVCRYMNGYAYLNTMKCQDVVTIFDLQIISSKKTTMKQSPKILLAVFLALSLTANIYFLLRRDVRPEPEINCTTCYPTNCGSTFPGLKVDLAANLIENYRNNHWTVLNTNLLGGGAAVQDSRSAWFSMQTIKRFIYEVESKTAANQSCGCDSLLGIRIYYGEYPTSNGKGFDIQKYPQLANLPLNYERLHTLVMIPTMRIGDLDKDFDPNYFTTGIPCMPVSFTDTALIASGTITALIPDSYNANMQNHGGLYPPPFKPPFGLVQCSGANFLHRVDRDFTCQ